MSRSQQAAGRQRIEEDAFGRIEIPAERLWGAETERARRNFVIGGENFRWPRSVIAALGRVKKCAAIANGHFRRLSADRVSLIVSAAEEVISGNLDDEFPLVVFQTGSGTQTNMNANEVIANRAIQLAGGIIGTKTPIDPHDDVNASQSSNDVFPTVMHLATVELLEARLFPSVGKLAATFGQLREKWGTVILPGRTHLQDATPLRLEAVFSGWQAQLEEALAHLRDQLPALCSLAIGGTAVGTGLNAPEGFGDRVAECLSRDTGRSFRSAPNKFAALSAHDALVSTSGGLRTLAGALLKIANDVRWYASGPRAGIGELKIPAVEAGSSIMPGKVNPTQCEALAMVAVQVFGNDHAIAFAGSQGSFQLNTYKPLILHNILTSITLLSDACESFRVHCASGIEPNLPVIEAHLGGLLMLATALSPHIGYDKATQIVRQAAEQNLPLREAAIASGFVSAEDFDRWVRPETMVGPLRSPTSEGLGCEETAKSTRPSRNA